MYRGFSQSLDVVRRKTEDIVKFITYKMYMTRGWTELSEVCGRPTMINESLAEVTCMQASLYPTIPKLVLIR